jgi:hypothetical protein
LVLLRNLWWRACWKPCTKLDWLDWMVSLTSLTSCTLPSYLCICPTWSRAEMSLTATWGNCVFFLCRDKREKGRYFNSSSWWSILFMAPRRDDDISQYYKCQGTKPQISFSICRQWLWWPLVAGLDSSRGGKTDYFFVPSLVGVLSASSCKVRPPRWYSSRDQDFAIPQIWFGSGYWAIFVYFQRESSRSALYSNPIATLIEVHYIVTLVVP